VNDIPALHPDRPTDPTDALAAALRSYAPRVRPPAELDGELRYTVEDTAVGRLLLAARADGTLLTSRFTADDDQVDGVLDRLADAVTPSVVRGGRALDPVRRELAEYLAGRRRRFDVPVDLTLATPFQREVLAALTGVGYGTTASYGQLARAVGRPAAARAVGSALNHNPVCIVVPCHRVVAATGALTGYAGGLPAKQHLLALEGGLRCGFLALSTQVTRKAQTGRSTS
jgi:methylated-DNA-[protein]-cysteine S-methyltransferase